MKLIRSCLARLVTAPFTLYIHTQIELLKHIENGAVLGFVCLDRKYFE